MNKNHGDWRPTSLRRIASVTTGKTVTPQPGSPADILAPYVTAANIQPLGRLIDVDDKEMWFAPHELKALDLRARDLLVVEGGAGYGRPALLCADRPGWGFQNHVNRVRPRNGLSDTRFLYYFLEHQLASGATTMVSAGATIPALSAEKLRSMSLMLPGLQRQGEIADFLDRETAQIDAMIEAQRELVERLDERRRAMLTDVVFAGAGTSCSDFRSDRVRYQPAGFGPLALALGLSCVPAAWDVVRFKAVMRRLEVRNSNGEATLMSLTSKGAVIPRTESGDRQQPAEESIPKYLLVEPGDLVVNPMWLTGGAIGVSAVAGAVSPDYRVFRSAGSHHPRYLHHLLRAPAYLEQYRLYTRAQTTFDRRVQQNDIDNLPLPTPPLDEQAHIARYLDASSSHHDATIAAANESIALMQERRSALITAAVTGRIDPYTGRETTPNPQEL